MFKKGCVQDLLSVFPYFAANLTVLRSTCKCSYVFIKKSYRLFRIYTLSAPLII